MVVALEPTEQQNFSVDFHEARASDEEHHLWSYCLPPLPKLNIPKPAAQTFGLSWAPGSKTDILEGDVYVDGSRIHRAAKWTLRSHLMRAGAGIATTSSPGTWDTLA